LVGRSEGRVVFVRVVLFDVGGKEVAKVEGVVGGEGHAVELIAEDTLVSDDGLDAIIHGLDVISLLDVLRVEQVEFGCGRVDSGLEVVEVVTVDAGSVFGGRTERGDFAG
jgi:hypothetical protein